jgi:predicted metalloprotease
MANWDAINSRGDVEDRRGMGAIAAGGIGIAGVVVIAAFTLLSGGNIGDVLNNLQGVNIQPPADTSQYQGQDSYEVFASTVLGSANDMWTDVFRSQGRTYRPPKLILFRTATESACGTATSSVGPHYCPLDEHIYLDETFFDELTNYLGASGGDVAQAYVITHEVGHHVQNQLGIIDQGSGNDFSIKLELQADCYAGLWAHSIKDRSVLEPGEISEALDAAAAVGDDRIQSKVEGQINPETWTHGSSRDRVNWFTTGYETGSFVACDTFK